MFDDFEIKPDKFKHSENRKKKRNMAAKALREKGAFSLRVEDGRKETYKRERLRVKDIPDGEFDDE